MYTDVRISFDILLIKQPYPQSLVDKFLIHELNFICIHFSCYDDYSVASNLVIKVGDFGHAKEEYYKEYYKSGGADDFHPVRWLAPESMIEGRFSLRSDVVRYRTVALVLILFLGQATVTP